MSDFSPNWLIASQSARFVLRERTVAVLALLFVVLVLISAWLGWHVLGTNRSRRRTVLHEITRRH